MPFVIAVHEVLGVTRLNDPNRGIGWNWLAASRFTFDDVIACVALRWKHGLTRSC